MGCQHIWLVPVLMFTTIQLTFVITYIIAVRNNHVVPVFPYISDSGAIPPESCLFGQMLNIGALFGIVTVYLRHRQIVEYYRCAKETKICIIKTSLVFMWLGIISSFGISVVGNFQETSVKTVHFIGALLAFGPGLLYGYGQTVLTYLIGKVFVGIWMGHFRLIISICGTILLICVLSTGFASSELLPTLNSSKTIDNTTYAIDRVQHVDGEEYHWYLVSAFGEWGFAICCILYFLTFAAEFRKSTLRPPRMALKSELCNRPNDTNDRNLPNTNPGPSHDHDSPTNRVQAPDSNSEIEVDVRLRSDNAKGGKIFVEKRLCNNSWIV